MSLNALILAVLLRCMRAKRNFFDEVFMLLSEIDEVFMLLSESCFRLHSNHVRFVTPAKFCNGRGRLQDVICGELTARLL